MSSETIETLPIEGEMPKAERVSREMSIGQRGSSKVSSILFDFDGTIANTAPGIVATMKATLEKMGKPVPTDEAIRQTIGIPLVKSLQQLGNLTDEEALLGVEIYTELFITIELEYTSIFPQVKETLEELRQRGTRMAVVTSRDKNSLEVILKRFGILDYFELLITHDDHLTPKPSPDMVLYALEKMNLKTDEAIIVGDTTYDILMGNRAGCETIAVTYGNHSREQLETSEPTVIIDEFGSIINKNLQNFKI